MTEVQFALLAMTAACIVTGIALRRQGAIGNGALAVASLVAIIIATLLYTS